MFELYKRRLKRHLDDGDLEKAGFYLKLADICERAMRILEIT